MEDPGSSECLTSPSSGAPKSKLDTLSKDDLIKFAKKQMAAMQKTKSKCAVLEKEVETLKQQARNCNSNSEDSILIQELTERMDALLLEKAETQQNLVLSRKELERTKQQAKDDLDTLRGELDRAITDHQRQIKDFESSIEQSNSKHQEDVAHLQELLKDWEQSAKQRESEREQASASEGGVDEVRRGLEASLESLRGELEAMQEQQSKAVAELQEGHQRELTKAQQEVENLREEMAQRALQHEEEMRVLEEDCEMERERLLLLHEELTEQLALKDSYLQDVQEEDEEPARGSGIARMLELSGCRPGDSSLGDGEETESIRLKAALEDLQAQNTMLQDELTLLCNVKAELEAELERAREDFQMEREELEFKIDELQMSREGFAADPAITPGLINVEPLVNLDPNALEANGEEASKDEDSAKVHPTPIPVQDPQELLSEEQQRLNQVTQDLQELRAQCEALTRERDSALAEYHHTRDILRGLETELGTKTRDFVSQYEAMKEQGAKALQDLQDKIKELSLERNKFEERVVGVTEEKNSLVEKVQDLEHKLEVYLGETQAKEDMKVNLQASVEEQTMLACELKESVEKLTIQNDEILSQLQIKETEAQELQEMVTNLTVEIERTQSLLQLRQEEVDRLINEQAKEIYILQEENKKAVDGLREEKERELEGLRQERDTEVKHLKEERQRLEDSRSSLELTMKDLLMDKANLQSIPDEASSALSRVQEEKELLFSKLADFGVQLEQETSEKQHLEARLNSLTKEAEQAQATIEALQESQSEALKGSTEEVLELQARIEELEKERSLLRSCLEEARGERRLEEEREELLARIEDLEKERDMLRRNLEEVVGDTEGLQKDLEAMKVVHEKIRGENHNLLEQISLTQEKEEKDAGERENMESERRKLEGQLTEKDLLIAQLRSEMATLQESASPCDSSEENVASQFTEKIALLEKESREKNEKMNKIKAVAVKAKKELDASKKEVVVLREEVESLKVDRERISSSMKDIIHGAEGYKNLQIDYDKLTERLDKERESVEAAERQIAELTKRLGAAVTQNEVLSSEKEDLLAAMETVRSTLKQLEAQHHELSRHAAGLDRDLLVERSMKEQKIRELSSATQEVEELTAQLRKQQQQSQRTAQELEQLRKEAQQSSLMDMEMADYERLVKELNAKLAEREGYVEGLKAQIHTHTQKVDTLQQEMEFMKSQLDQGEEKSSKMKQLLVKTKKELADSKKQEASQMMVQASLKGELEANQQQLESAKIEVSELMSERHRLQEQLRCMAEQQHRTTSSLQQRMASLQQECNTAKAELLSTTGEFESYKVRVHNVLKQQKNKTSAQSEGEPGKMERERLSSQVEQLRARLLDSQHSLQSSAEELQQLQSEHDALLDRHNKILQETVAKEAELRERLLSVQAENVSLRSEQAQAQAELQSQADAQRQGFREQIRRLQDEHRATVETLQGQLTRLEGQLFTLQSQSSSVTVTSVRKSLASDPQRRNQEHGQGTLGFLALGDLQSMAREEGEGMETTETESSSPALTPLPSLEQLLTSPDPKQEPFVWTVEPTKEELSQKLTTVTRSMEHMNSLLHETEATNAVLMEQVNLLKSEVRRLERNQEREKSVANLEYLKNVLLQFIFLHSGSERQALLPVIHTMLQLSPEEKSKLAAIAQGDEEVPGSRGSGWTSYLHSWSGIR